MMSKLIRHGKISLERSVFLRINAYLCPVIDDFASLDLQHQDKCKI